MKYIWLIFFVGMMMICQLSAQQPVGVESQTESGYYFFDDEDIQNIRAAAQTDWGQQILSVLREQVQERRRHSLRVPLLEAGYGHHYFCPKHNVKFRFDWDNPYRHYCSLCDRYWENVNIYDWAWVNMLHNENLKYLVASMYLYIATADTTYAGYIRDMMLDYASKYPTYMEHDSNRKATSVIGMHSIPGRMYSQSLDESVWASDAARAYWVAKPVMTAGEIKKVEDGYLNVCANMLLRRRVYENWQVWHNSGLAALGVALQNDSIIRIALNDPAHGYHLMMKHNVTNEGWWREGSPIYHFYPLRAMLLTADAVRCRGINLFDQRLYNMLANPASGVYANLDFPAHNDGWYGESLIQQLPLYEIACQRYKDPFFADILKAGYRIKERTSSTALQNGVDLSKANETLPFKSINFEDLGVAILRSGEKAVAFKYGPHGGGHGHPDKLSISLFNGKNELLSDLGTPAYGGPDHAQWYVRTVAHSTITVDGKDQTPAKGQLISFKPATNGGSVEAKVEKTYPDVEMTRNLNLQGNHLTDIFSCTSSGTHIYDYVLILTQKPNLSEKGEQVDISGAAGYNRIINTEIRKAKQQISFRIEGAEINIQLLSGSEFEVITGEAPGIPPRNPFAWEEEYVEKPVYPLLIRVKDKNVKIKTEWKIK